MLINSLTKMERIVDSHPELSWDGWDVIRHKKNPSAQFDSSGSFYKGSWHKKFVFPLTESGWSIPENIGRLDV
jgi:hypothetical protein